MAFARRADAAEEESIEYLANVAFDALATLRDAAKKRCKDTK
jgi:hypothetical protein